MSSRLASFLCATSGGSGNAFLIRSDACSFERWLRKMLLMFGRPLENVVTSGTLFEPFSRPLTIKSSARSLVFTFVSLLLHDWNKAIVRRIFFQKHLCRLIQDEYEYWCLILCFKMNNSYIIESILSQNIVIRGSYLGWNRDFGTIQWLFSETTNRTKKTLYL